jgi:hypothetical protein
MIKSPRPSFYFMVSNHDRQVYSLHGPMTDGTRQTKIVWEEQQKGRKISCSSVEATTLRAAEAQALAVHPHWHNVLNALEE